MPNDEDGTINSYVNLLYSMFIEGEIKDELIKDNDTYNEIASNAIPNVGTLITDTTYSSNEGVVIPPEENLVLEATKALEGKTLTEQDFNFIVMGGETEVATFSNDEAGKITFSEITYKEAGRHTCTIKEVAGNVAGMTYDETKFTVTVEVQDVDGQLVASTVVYSANAIFENIVEETTTTTTTEETTGETSTEVPTTPESSTTGLKDTPGGNPDVLKTNQNKGKHLPNTGESIINKLFQPLLVLVYLLVDFSYFVQKRT